MKLGRCIAENFGSYEHLELDLSDVGLGLIYGSTGAGKSTIEDLPCWILFGVTAKGGSVDEIKSWTATGLTKGHLEVNLTSGNIAVVRTRGSSNENDLYWVEVDTLEQQRGDNLKHTQELLNKRLGIDASAYLSGAYFSEFSDTGAFFTAKPKDKRALFENIVSMDFPMKLLDQATSHKKKVSSDLTRLQLEQAKLQARLEQSIESYDKNKIAAETFEKDRLEKLKLAEVEYDKWEQQKYAKIEEDLANLSSLEKTIQSKAVIDRKILSAEKMASRAFKEICDKCGGPIDSETHDQAVRLLSGYKEEKRDNSRRIEQFERDSKQLEHATKQNNPHAYQLEQLKSPVNYPARALKEDQESIDKYSVLLGNITKNIASLEQKHESLRQLQDLSYALRGELLRKSIKVIESETNNYLTEYFDSEIRVSFELKSLDSLDVNIMKGCYPCSYTQLSKGQRALLRLCFSIPIMKATANNRGIHFDALFFDESLDGLDSELKAKAYRLFQELSIQHSTVFLIDHEPSFQSLFDKRYHVSLIEDKSILELETE